MPNMNIAAVVAPLVAEPRQAAIYLDIDGTLAPVVERADEARVPDTTRRLLEVLSERYLEVACLSGRPAVEARRLVGLNAIKYVGNHGLEQLAPHESKASLAPEAEVHRDRVRAFVEQWNTPETKALEIRMEDKDTIWAFHWRGAADEAKAESTLREIAAAAEREGLAQHWGRKVLEVRPRVDIDKGTVLSQLVLERGPRYVLFAGDDYTDLDGFHALRELEADGTIAGGLCVGIRSREGPNAIVEDADLAVDGSTGFVAVLRALAV